MPVTSWAVGNFAPRPTVHRPFSLSFLFRNVLCLHCRFEVYNTLVPEYHTMATRYKRDSERSEKHKYQVPCLGFDVNAELLRKSITEGTVESGVWVLHQWNGKRGGAFCDHDQEVVEMSVCKRVFSVLDGDTCGTWFLEGAREGDEMCALFFHTIFVWKNDFFFIANVERKSPKRWCGFVHWEGGGG